MPYSHGGRPEQPNRPQGGRHQRQEPAAPERQRLEWPATRPRYQGDVIRLHPAGRRFQGMAGHGRVVPLQRDTLRGDQFVQRAVQGVLRKSGC